MLIVTLPPTLFARQVASRRLSGDGAVVIVELPQAPAFVSTSAVVETVNEAPIALAGSAATTLRVPATTATAVAPAIRQNGRGRSRCMGASRTGTRTPRRGQSTYSRDGPNRFRRN